MHTLEKLVLPSGVASNTQSLFEYWCSLRGREIVPNRSDVKPVAILPLLPNLVILEYRDDGALVFRLAGTVFADSLGFELTGANLFDHIAPHQCDNAKHRMGVVRDYPCGLLFSEKLQSKYNTPFISEVICLPLRDSKGQITQLLGCASLIEHGVKGSLLNAPAHMITVTAQFLDIGAGLPQTIPDEILRAI